MVKQSGFWIKTAALFLVRSGRSTAALSLMVVAAVATLVFLSALAIGVNDAMIRNSVQLYSGHVSGFSLPSTLAQERLVVEGTSAVLKRVPLGGVLAGADTFQTVILLGVDPALERMHAAFWKKNLRGDFLTGSAPEIFISQSLASSLAVDVGDTVGFSVGDMQRFSFFTVCGLYATGIEQLDRGLAFCSLEYHPSPHEPWTAAVFLDAGIDPEAVISIYRETLPGNLSFASWSELMPDLRQLIDLNYFSMSLVMVLVFGVVSLGIACAFVIFIMRHLREYGILKAMGVTAGELTRLIVAEIMLMNLGASLAGMLIGAAAVWIVGLSGIDLTAFTSHNRYFAVSGMIYPRLTVFSLISPPVLALVFSLGASLWPALLVRRKKAAEIFRVG
jgi:ABC-type lipoprotein release transport system permease subunit